MKTYQVQNVGSREMISPVTIDRSQAEAWARESESHESQPEVEVVETLVEYRIRDIKSGEWLSGPESYDTVVVLSREMVGRRVELVCLNPPEPEPELESDES